MYSSASPSGVLQEFWIQFMAVLQHIYFKLFLSLECKLFLFVLSSFDCSLSWPMTCLESLQSVPFCISLEQLLLMEFNHLLCHLFSLFSAFLSVLSLIMIMFVEYLIYSFIILMGIFWPFMHIGIPLRTYLINFALDIFQQRPPPLVVFFL